MEFDISIKEIQRKSAAGGKYLNFDICFREYKGGSAGGGGFLKFRQFPSGHTEVDIELATSNFSKIRMLLPGSSRINYSAKNCC